MGLTLKIVSQNSPGRRWAGGGRERLCALAPSRRFASRCATDRRKSTS